MYGKKIKLRILIVTQYFWPENFRINDLALYFANKGHEVTVLTGWPNYPNGNIYEDFKANKKKFNNLKNIKILRVPIIPRGKNKFFLVANYLSFIITSIFFSCFKFKKKNFDLIFTAQYSPVFVALTSIFISKLKKIKHIIWVQDLWPETLLDLKILNKGKIFFLLKRIVNYIFKNSDLIFTQSNDFRKIIKKNYNIKNVFYFPNWPEDIFIKPNSKKKIYKNYFFNIVFTGNIGQAQDFKNIIKTAYFLKKYNKIFWHIYGDGRMLAAAREEVKKKMLEKNFLFYGKKPLKNIPNILYNADVLIITMLKSNFLQKTIPGKFQAYLTAKKPIIGMIDGTTSAIIKKYKVGLVCKSSDFNNFAKNILKIYKAKDHVRKRYGKNAYNFYLKNFNKNKILNFLEKKMMAIVK